MDHHHHQGGSFQPQTPTSPPQNSNNVDDLQQQQFSYDISNMSEWPSNSILGHKRAQSEILSLPDDIRFDSNSGVVGAAHGSSSLSDYAEGDLFSMYIDLEKFGATATSSGESYSSVVAPAAPPAENEAMVISERLSRIRHHHSQSMDGSSTIKPELLGGGTNFTGKRKTISSAKLAELALIDPKRAKRICANRQSAVKSKERKMRYISELERKAQALQTEATTLSTRLTMLQRDSSGLNAENQELKLHLNAVEQEGRLKDALNDTLRDEVQQLKLMTGQNTAGAGSMMNSGPSHGPGQQFYPNNQNQAMRLQAAQQLQQLQIQQSHQIQQQQQQVQQQALPSIGQRESSSNNHFSGDD